MEKVVMVGMMSVLLAIPLRKDKSEFSTLLILLACLLISAMACYQIRDLVNFLKKLEDYIGSGAVYLKVLLKMVGITYVAEFGANLCRDAGYQAVAGQIEFWKAFAFGREPADPYVIAFSFGAVG